MAHDVIVIGAGVAGLQCGRELLAAGRLPLLLDRSRGVGGRCATRRFEGQPVDYGPLFFHGHVPAFVAALEAVDGPRAAGWPQRIEGSGPACQPDAFAAFEQRRAFADGMTVFPKHLARGLDIKLQTRVDWIEVDADGFGVTDDAGRQYRCRDLVLALALEQSAELLRRLPRSAEVEGALQLLAMFASVPSLTVIAGYPPDAPMPSWDICFPERSLCLQLLACDSSKRRDPKFVTLVGQARPRWSRERLDQPAERWRSEILDAAAALAGNWVRQPLWTHAHCWRYARVDRGNELQQPIVLRFSGGQRLGLAGDIFAAGGGVQAAWLSGQRLAQRLTHED